MNPEITIPSITFLNMTGDVTITWDETNKEAILALVQEKMNQGFTFFLIKPRKLLPGSKRVKAKSIDDVAKAGSVTIEDNDVERIVKALRLHDTEVEEVVSSGKAQLTLIQGGRTESYDTVQRARTASEVVQHQTVAVRRVVGG